MRRWLTRRSFTLVYATGCETKRRIRRNDDRCRHRSIFQLARILSTRYSLKHVKKYFKWRTVNVFRALSFDRSVPKTIQLWCTVSSIALLKRFYGFATLLLLLFLLLNYSQTRFLEEGSTKAILVQTFGIKVILTSTVQFRGYIKLRLYHISSIFYHFCSCSFRGTAFSVFSLFRSRGIFIRPIRSLCRS